MDYLVTSVANFPKFVGKASRKIELNNLAGSKARISKSPFNNKIETYKKNFLLPEQNTVYKNKKTLVLDLDETLVHSTFERPNIEPSLELSTVYENKLYNIYVQVRPGLQHFLSELSPYYEIVIFTASMKEYADIVISSIDHFGLCKHRLYRDSCILNNNKVFIKDLKRLGRDMSNVILLDNSPHCYSLTPENGLPIKTWYDDKLDRELYRLIPILKKLSEFYDVRSEIDKLKINENFMWSLASKWLQENDSKNKTLTLSSSEKNLKISIRKEEEGMHLLVKNSVLIEKINTLSSKLKGKKTDTGSNIYTNLQDKMIRKKIEMSQPQIGQIKISMSKKRGSIEKNKDINREKASSISPKNKAFENYIEERKKLNLPMLTLSNFKRPPTSQVNTTITLQKTYETEVQPKSKNITLSTLLLKDNLVVLEKNIAKSKYPNLTEVNNIRQGNVKRFEKELECVIEENQV